MNWKELNEQRDYLPTDHGTCTREPNDNLFLTEEEKKQKWDNFNDQETNRLLETTDDTPL